MMLKASFLLIFALIINPGTVKAQVDQPGKRILRPEMVHSQVDLKYWLAKNIVLDVDGFLIEQGIEAESCIYQSEITGAQTSFKGVGRCLYLNFVESLKTEKLSGKTYFWIKGMARDTNPFEVRWRPPVGGMKKIISQVIEMKFEKPLYWLRKHSQPETAENIRYEQFIGGSWDIIVPGDEKSLSQLQKTSNKWFNKFIGKIKEISFTLEPSSRVDGMVVHKGEIAAEVRSDILQGDEVKRFQVQTNINLLVKSRTFFFDIKSEMKPNETAVDDGAGGYDGN